MSTPDLRAGDADRDRTIGVLQSAYAEGRITQEEFETRMGHAQEARTYRELSALTADLPSPPPDTSVEFRDRRAKKRAELRKGWISLAGVALITNAIWLAGLVTSPGQPHYYWPIWVMGPWGAAMLVATIVQVTGVGDKDAR